MYYFCLEHSGRGRKAKNEDSNEHQITPNVIHKKRAAIESKHLQILLCSILFSYLLKYHLSNLQREIMKDRYLMEQ